MIGAFRYAAILVWGSVVLLGPNVQTVRADGGHGGMMCGHMCEGHDHSKQDEHSSYDLKHFLKHGKEIGLTAEQISKLKTMQLDQSRAQARAERRTGRLRWERKARQTAARDAVSNGEARP